MDYDNYSWPWIFFINLPIWNLSDDHGDYVSDYSEQKRANAAVDFTGIGRLAIGSGSMQVVLEKGNREGWFDSSIITTLAVVSGMAW